VARLSQARAPRSVKIADASAGEDSSLDEIAQEPELSGQPYLDRVGVVQRPDQVSQGRGRVRNRLPTNQPHDTMPSA
jgi:hypothetical protein